MSRVQNLIGDYQRPPEVLENVGNIQNRLNMGQQPQETYSILNQQWEDPPHMQAPMAPMNMNAENNEYQKMEPPYPIVNAPVNSMTVTNRQVEINSPGVNPMQPNNTNNSHRSQISGILSTNMTSRGVKHSVFNGQMLENREHREEVNINYRGNTNTDPVNHDSMQDKSLQDLGRSDKKSGNSGESEDSIKRVLPDDGIFTNLVKDSIMAHVREGIRPMFVNNYYVGDNSWKPGATEGNTKATQEVDTLTNRSNMAVQTAISSLGEDGKSESYMQTGISRVKAMGNNDGMYNKQSPLVVEPGKNPNSTGCSTNSYSLPDLQLNTLTQQQWYKGLPDLTVPPPVVPPPAMAQPPVVPP